MPAAHAVLLYLSGEGNWLAKTETGVKMVGPEPDRALKNPAVVKQR